MIINNEDLANYLVELALMCIENDTNNCDITITTLKGKINCHIEFEGETDGK